MHLSTSDFTVFLNFQEGKAEEGEIRPTRKRRWGSTTLKTITSQPSTNISTESLKVSAF